MFDAQCDRVGRDSAGIQPDRLTPPRRCPLPDFGQRREGDKHAV